MSRNSSKNDSAVKNAFTTLGGKIRIHYRIIIVIAAGFIAASALNFFNVAAGQTIGSFTLDDFEVGQVADRTIYANKSLPADELNPVSIEEGEKIIRKGFPITEESYMKLKKMAESPIYLDYRAFADSELFLLLITAMWFILFAFIPFGRKIRMGEIVLEVSFFLIVYAVTAFGGKTQLFSAPFALPVIIPSSLCVFLVAILYGQLSSVLFSFLLAFGVLAAGQWQLVPFLFVIASCLAAGGIVRKIERRIDMVFASLLLSLLDVVFIVLYAVIFNEPFSMLPWAMGGVAFNGFISGILTLGFLTPLEMVLNTASVFRLMDLSDLNNPIMRKMLLTASGTYNHSLMVAQLAEAACREIGANPLVARVGAYYHDIGKMEQSEYFVENQNGENKHNDINPSLSVSVIRSHVKKGVEKAHQLHLPQQIIDIIAEHHGNSVIAYFYNEAKEKDPNVSPEDFSYNGNPPTTRESAVVMLADTVEAACRTLENPSAPRLDKFIQGLINAKVEHKQLDNSGLSFRDVSKVKDTFVQILAGYYHNRIEYPNQKDPDANDAEQNDRTGENDKAEEKDRTGSHDKTSDGAKKNGK